MEWDGIVQLISSVGFPIVMSLVLFKYIDKQSENHVTETKGLQESIQNNTNAISQLSTFIQLLANDISDIKGGIRNNGKVGD